MPPVIGIDPGTVSIDVCGMEDGVVFLDRSIPTADALAEPEALVRVLADAHAVLIAGPSGYGLPLVPLRDLTDEMLRLAYLAAPGESGGIGGLGTLARAMAQANLPVVFTPGVIHLPSVPAARKVNRVDLGTADKVCATALAIHEQATRRGCAPGEVSCILLELGGAFSAAIAVDEGRVVDGIGGTSGPLGVRSSGAWDGEVAFLAGALSKSMLFRGGMATIAGRDDLTVAAGDEGGGTPRDRLARDAFIEGAVKAVAALLVSVPSPYEIVLSGRAAHVDDIARALHLALARYAPVRRLTGFAAVKEAAQGAALIADGLAGGRMRALTDALALREAGGTVLDHLYVISPADARRRLGLA